MSHKSVYSAEIKALKYKSNSMKIAEVKNIFFDIAGKDLIKRGFKHIRTKGMYEMVEGDFKFIVTAYFTKWSSCTHLNLSVGISYLPCEKIIKRETGFSDNFILFGDLKRIANLLSLAFDDNNKWDVVYDEHDAILKFKDCVSYIDTIAVPFWDKTRDVNFLYNYAKRDIFKPNLLLGSYICNLLNIVCLAFLTNQTQTDFERLLSECYQHSTLENERFKMIFDKFVTYIENNNKLNNIIKL